MRTLKISLLIFILSIIVPAQWYQQNSGTATNLNSIFFIDESAGWVCGDSGKISKTTNGGLDWLEQNSNTTYGLKAIQFVDVNNGWAYSLNQILRTTDGGLSWDVQNTSPSHIIALQFVNLNTGWIIYQILDLASFISKTTDGGITWTIQFQSPNEYYEAMFFLDENYGWVTSFLSGGVIKTTNSGNSWTWHNGNFSGAPMCIRFVNQMTGWVSHNTLGSYEISKSTDGGVTWFPQISESGKFINSVSSPTSSIGYAAGFQMFVPPNPYEGFILKTTNGGTNWTEQFREEGILNSIFFLNDTIGWSAGNDGKILVTENGGVTSVDDNCQLNPNEFILSQNYPNPFNPATKIRFEIPGQARNDNSLVTLKVYDLLGREIATLVKEEKPTGEYEVEFSAIGESASGGNGSVLPSGIYFYQLKAGDPSSGSGQVFVETRKMVLLR